MKLVSAWDHSGKIYLVERTGSDVRIRTTPAKYSFFITGLSDEDRYALARDKNVIGVSVDRCEKYTRVDCATYYDRKNILEILTEIIERNSLKSEILEADVSPIRRLMADTPNLEIDANPRVMYIDIETDSRCTFDDAISGKSRLLTWAVCDKNGENLKSACLEEDTDKSEIFLFEQLIETMRNYDCIIAWYGDGFDFPVIKNRAEFLGVKYRGNSIPWQRWTWLDHLEVKKKHDRQGSGDEKQSLALDYVAKSLLGEDQGKLDFDAGKTWEFWEKGGEFRERLLRYNEQDTLLLPRIEEKTGFINLQFVVCQICRIFPNTNSLQATSQGDGFLLRLGDELNYRWPTKKLDCEFEKFKGAYVMDPTITGIVENVHVADFAGLYPSIMRTFNISPETKIGEKLIGDVGKYCQLPERTTYFVSPEVQKGLFIIALDQLVAKRAEYTKKMKLETPGSEEHEMYRRLSQAVKVVANSFYGILGSKYSRFFDPEAAEGVTQTGKWLLYEVIGESERNDLVPFYADTDSVFVSGDKEKFIEVVDNINKSWAGRLKPWGVTWEHYIDLDFEKTFFRVIMIKKKRYVGKFLMYKGKPVPEDAKPEVKGLEFNRGDTSKIAREFQKEVIFKFFDKKIPEVCEIKEVVNKWKVRTYKGKFNLDDIMISKSLSKPLNDYKDPLPPHVRVAKILRDRGEDVKEGTKIRYVVVPNEDKKIKGIPVSDLENIDDIDRVYYWSKQFYPPVERILEKVYPDFVWKETNEEIRYRELESRCQRNLFDGVYDAPANAGIRRKKAISDDKKLIINICNDCKMDYKYNINLISAIKSVVKIYPGKIPIFLFINTGAEIFEINTREFVRESRELIAALKRVIKIPNSFEFLSKF